MTMIDDDDLATQGWIHIEIHDDSCLLEVVVVAAAVVACAAADDDDDNNNHDNNDSFNDTSQFTIDLRILIIVVVVLAPSLSL